jgi:hypothetical protein
MVDIVNKTLNTKVGSLTLLDGALIGASKLASEQALSMIPMIGNGTMTSGLIKVGLAVGGSMITKNNKALQIVSTGILIDGMEDLVLYAKQRFFGKATAQASAQVNAFA